MTRPSVACALVLAGCVGSSRPQIDTGLDRLSLSEVHPALIVADTRIDVVGGGFVGPSLGANRLILRGTLGGRAIDVTVPADFADETHLRARADLRFFAALGGEGHFDGQVLVVVDSTLDGSPHPTPSLPVSLDLAQGVNPELSGIVDGTLFVNGGVQVDGKNFLLGDQEGETHAVVTGCFQPTGAAVCSDVGTADLTVTPRAPWDRQHGTFSFAPSIAGIYPGTFTGQVRIENRTRYLAPAVAGMLPLNVTVKPPAITSVSPQAASLGQYVDVKGGGFVGGAADEITLIHLTGTFTRAGAPSGTPADLMLVAHFASGGLLRYVLDETDALGRLIDLRRVSGTFVGQATPIVRKGTTEVIGDPQAVTLGIAPVKQVVYLRFQPSYLDSLRLYGLLAADALVRARVLAVAARDYAGVNIEFRTTPPEDFALYSQVDIVGPDPNGLGLFGYDNTPGKDVGNARLFDRIGGVNATTQSDGFPGFGGIFAEQFFGYSHHPITQVEKLPGIDTDLFDRAFDPVRPDRGTPAMAAEVMAGVATTDGSNCPATPGERNGALSCAIFVLGNLIGSTMTHEVGHSLGLADPGGELFHDPGNAPNRLMNAGSARPFAERAQLQGLGPAVFCDAEYTYLRTILAGASTPDPGLTRPGCN